MYSIRCLYAFWAFDKNGSNIQLIGRNQVFSCILPAVFAKIAEPEFQSAWEKADALTDHEVQTLSMLHRQIKTQELLQRAVEQSVHYAILSHTWMRDGARRRTYFRTLGYTRT